MKSVEKEKFQGAIRLWKWLHRSPGECLKQLSAALCKYQYMTWFLFCSLPQAEIKVIIDSYSQADEESIRGADGQVLTTA